MQPTNGASSVSFDSKMLLAPFAADREAVRPQNREKGIMSKVFVNIGLSLDGYMAPEGMNIENWGTRTGAAKWGALMSWILKQQ